MGRWSAEWSDRECRYVERITSPTLLQMIILKIDVTKIDKTKVFEGKKGKYLDLVLHENKGGRDQYDNDGFVAHSTTKDERAAGVRGSIVGNWKHSGSGVRKPAERQADAQKEEKKFPVNMGFDDDIPF